MRYILILVFIISSNIYAKKVQVCYDNNPQPPFYLGHGSKIPIPAGALVELIEIVFQKMNLAHQYRRLSIRKCMAGLSSGEIDMVFPVKFKYSRIKYGEYPYLTENKPKDGYALSKNHYHLIVNKDLQAELYNKKLVGKEGAAMTMYNKELKDEDIIFSLPLGYPIINDIMKLKYRIVLANSSEIALYNVQSGKVHATVILQPVAEQILEKNKHKYAHLIILSENFLSKPEYTLFSKKYYAKNKELVEEFWEKTKEVLEHVK